MNEQSYVGIGKLLPQSLIDRLAVDIAIHEVRNHSNRTRHLKFVDCAPAQIVGHRSYRIAPIDAEFRDRKIRTIVPYQRNIRAVKGCNERHHPGLSASFLRDTR